MSSSKKKNSFAGYYSCPSEKQDKRDYNRRFRRKCKQILYSNYEIELLPHLYDYSNIWAMGKDGKKWFNPKEYPEKMRK